MLTTILILVLLASLLFFYMGTRVEKRGVYDPDKVVKSLVVSYAWIICGLLCWLIIGFIGLGKSGSPKIPLDKLRRISHTGYYCLPQEKIIITGNDTGEGFKNEILSENEEIILKPVWKKDPESYTTDSWELSYRVYNQPLRLDGECINFPEDWWLNPDDTLVIVYKEKNQSSRYISIKWLSKVSGFPFKKLKNFYYFNQGEFAVDKAGTPQLERQFDNDILLTKKILKEGLNLYSLIRHSLEGRRITVNIPEWWTIAGQIRFIRKEKGNASSDMGVHIADELFKSREKNQDNPFRFFRRTKNNDFIELQPIDPKLNYTTIPSKTKISYGFGVKDQFSLLLSDNTTETPLLGNVMEVRFEQPLSWPLPPQIDKKKDFIITSSSEHIALDGYLIHGADNLNPFYAKAAFNRSEDSLSLVVNDGRIRKSYKLDEPIYLGDFKNGVSLSLTELKPAVSYTGLLAVIFIVAATLVFSMLIRFEREMRQRLDLAWALIWGLTLTILSVRLILSYRVSLLPPQYIDTLQLVNVFHKSLKLSIKALLVTPIFLLLVRFIAVHWGEIKYRLKKLFQKLPVLKGAAPGKVVKLRDKFRIYLLLFFLIILLLGLLGTNESFIGRINIIAHILVISLIAVFARRIFYSNDRRERLLFFLTVIGAPILIGLVIKDFGFLIYEIPLSICIVAAWLCSTSRRRAAWIGILLIALLTLLLFVAPHVPGIPFLQKAVHLGFPDNVFYRVVKFKGAEESLLLSRSSDDISMTMLLRNSHQNWQMLHYASRGIAAPKGYGQAPLSDTGMTYPTAMSDCVFSIFLLSEHGGSAGTALILIYIMLGAVCLYGACSLPDMYKHRLIPLTAIGAFFAFNSLYMACANLGLTIFTGQNIPLLGLYSLSDLVQGSILIAFITFLFREGIEADCPSDNPRVYVPLLAFIIITFLLVVILCPLRMGQLAKPGSSYLKDHNFSGQLFQSIKDHLPGFKDMRDPGKPLELKGETLLRRPFGKLKPIEKIFVEQFNNRPDKFNPDGGLIYLEKNPDYRQGERKNIVRINRNYFILRSPFDKNRMWRGQIASAEEESAPTIMALSYPCTVSMSESGHAASISMDSRRSRRDVHTNRKVLIKARSIAFFELIRSGNKLELIPKDNPGWSLYIDGEKIETHFNQSKELKQYNLIVIENIQAEKASRYNLIYLGMQSPVLAFVQWRNGDDCRIFPGGAVFPMAYTLGKTADYMANCSMEIPDKLSLTLDFDLHTNLQKEIDGYGRNHETYMKRRNLSDTKVLAAAVMDSFSGEIVALPSWPSFNPGDPRFEENLLKLSPLDHSKLLRNNNLRNHAVGSTIKPLIFSAASAGFHGKLDPAQLVIYHKKEPVTETALPDVKCPHTFLGKIPFSEWDCRQPVYTESNARDYLVYSRNYTEVAMGMLGMLLGKADLDKILVPDAVNFDLEYNGYKYALDFTKVKDSPFTLEDRYPVPRTSAMNDTILFKNLEALYDVGLSGNTQDILFSKGQVFLPFFFKMFNEAVEQENDRKSEAILKKLKSNDFLDEVSPEPVNFRPKDFQSIRSDLISFFLGGASCRWNNIHIMEALTRIVTGYRVKARLELNKEEIPVTAGPMPAPINEDSNWKNVNLIDPLEDVGEEGTAAGLSGIVHPPYRIVYKTGTMEERYEKVESEMLFFLIGRWDNEKGNFVPGETLSCYLYMEDSKAMDDQAMKKFMFARPIIITLKNYLEAALKEKIDKSKNDYGMNIEEEEKVDRQAGVLGLSEIEGFYTAMSKNEDRGKNFMTLDIKKLSGSINSWNVQCSLSTYEDIKKVPGTFDSDEGAIYVKGIGIGKIGRNNDGKIIIDFFIDNKEVRFVQNNK